jgi:hypothetical protein
MRKRRAKSTTTYLASTIAIVVLFAYSHVCHDGYEVPVSGPDHVVPNLPVVATL